MPEVRLFGYGTIDDVVTVDRLTAIIEIADGDGVGRFLAPTTSTTPTRWAAPCTGQSVLRRTHRQGGVRRVVIRGTCTSTISARGSRRTMSAMRYCSDAGWHATTPPI